MLALCSMLYPTYYAKNYAGIMGAGLKGRTVSKANKGNWRNMDNKRKIST